MTPAEALRRAAVAGRLGRFEISRHAGKRMNERNLTRADLAAALKTAIHAVPEGSRFCLRGGADLGGAPLTVVVSIDDRCVVVTAH